MSDGQILKPEKDFSNEADKQIPEAQELAKVVKAARDCYRSRANTVQAEQCPRRNRKAYAPRKANKTSAAPLSYP